MAVNYSSYFQDDPNSFDKISSRMEKIASLEEAKRLRDKEKRASEIAAQDAERKNLLLFRLGELATSEETRLPDYKDLIAEFPEFADAIIKQYDSFSGLEKKNKANILSRLYTLSKTDNPELVRGELNKYLEVAERTRGAGGDVVALRAFLNTLDSGGLGALSTALGTAVVTIGDKNLVDNINDREEQLLNENEHLLDLEELEFNRKKHFSEEQTKLEDRKKTTFSQENKLRDEVDKTRKELVALQQSYLMMKKSAAMANGVGDVGLVTAFMKMIDPGSVVRESEFARGQETGSLYNSLQAKINQIMSGEILTPKIRKNFLEFAERALESTEDLVKTRLEITENIIKDYGLNRDNVLGRLGVSIREKTETETETEEQTENSPDIWEED